MASFWMKVFALTAALLPKFAVAADALASSTFYFSPTGTQFSINIPENSTDLYIYFSSPAFSWVAVGIGSQMTNALMFVMYSSADGKNVTISPRTSTTHSEPTYLSSLSLSALPGTTITNSTYTLHAVCRNCTTWPTGSLSLASTSQPFLFAYGPDIDLTSDSPRAPLRRHSHIGAFTMDMLKARGGEGAVPPAKEEMDGAVLVGSVRKDKDVKGTWHAVMMGLAIFVIMPLKVVVAAKERGKGGRMGMVMGGLVLTAVLVGLGLGISVSLEYNRSKSFVSGHQVLGFIFVGFVLLLFGHGFLIQPKRNPAKEQHLDQWAGQHGQNVKVSMPPAPTARIHSWGGRLLWIVAVVNGGIGLEFATAPRRTVILYVLVTLAVTLGMMAVYSLAWWRQKKEKERAGGPDTEDSEVILENYWQGVRAQQQQQQQYQQQQQPQHQQYQQYQQYQHQH